MDYLSIALAVFSVIANFTMGIIMFFIKFASDELKDKFRAQQEAIKMQQSAIDKIKDEYIKKEDFREFKEELFVRLDEIKIDFKREVERLQK